MTSVKEMVDAKKKQQAKQKKEWEDYEKKEEQRRNTEQYSAEIEYLMERFEWSAFCLGNTKKEVAEKIFEKDGMIYLTYGGDRKQERNYLEIEPELSQIKFRPGGGGRQYLTKSPRFVKWKKALEKKFGVELRFRRDYRYESRFGSSGFETYTDKIFQGVVVHIVPK